MRPSSGLKEEVYRWMRQLPEGKVTTYGDIAVLAGHPSAPRIVGGIAHFGPDDIPWHRLVNRYGGLARGYPGGMEGQAQRLLEEGIEVENYLIKDFETLRWKPIALYH